MSTPRIIEFRGEIRLERNRLTIEARVGNYQACTLSVEMPNSGAAIPIELIDAACEALGVRLRTELGSIAAETWYGEVMP